MKVGGTIICQNFFKAEEPDDSIYEEDLRLADMYEGLGYDSIWTVEHHFSPYTMVPDALQMLTYLAGRTKKVLMLEAFHGLLPPIILRRRKVGFSVPLALWLRTDLRSTVHEILSESEVRRLGYLRYPEVERIKTEHLAGRANHENKLWALINLVCWHRQWKASAA